MSVNVMVQELLLICGSHNDHTQREAAARGVALELVQPD
jgi:hypothetical protein